MMSSQADKGSIASNFSRTLPTGINRFPVTGMDQNMIGSSFRSLGNF
jgi:hypothetical protein